MLDRIVYWLFRLTILLMRPLPLRAGYWVAENVAVVCYLTIFPRHRRALRANLARVLESDDAAHIETVARRSFRNFGKYVVDFIHYPSMTREEVLRRLRFDRYDELDAAATSGRGIIIATIHFGTWDVGAAALAARGYRVNAIAERFAYAPMNELVQGSRARLGMTVMSSSRAGPSAFRALRRGEMLALLIDVASEGERAVRVDFFGAPALVSSAAARLALRTNAWVVPAVVVRGPGDDLEIRPSLDFSLRDFAPTGNEAADVAELTRLTLRALEAPIRQHPDQWFIFQPLWNAPFAPGAPVREHAS